MEELLAALEDYELPEYIKSRLVGYYERLGEYGQAEDILFELLEVQPDNVGLIELGRAFYARLLAKSDADLLAGNFSREEVEDGLKQLRKIEQ